MTDRTAADYAIEHAGYLANAANRYLDAINAEYLAQMDHDEAESPETEKVLDAAIEAVGEASQRLRSCIYEFEKRRDRAAMAAASSGAQPEQQQGQEPVAEVVSWTNGSYSRNYKLNWLRDVSEGTKLYVHPAMSTSGRTSGDAAPNAPSAEGSQ